MKGLGFLSFAKNFGEDIIKNVRGKYGQKLLDHAKQSTIDTFKTTSKRVIQKATEATGDLIGNKLANRIPKYSNNAQQNNSETLTNEYDKEKPKEIIDDLRLI